MTDDDARRHLGDNDNPHRDAAFPHGSLGNLLDQLEGRPVGSLADVNATTVVADRCEQMESQLNELLQARMQALAKAEDAAALVLRQRDSMRDLDERIAVHRLHVAAWRRARLYVDEQAFQQVPS